MALGNRIGWQSVQLSPESFPRGHRATLETEEQSGFQSTERRLTNLYSDSAVDDGDDNDDEDDGDNDDDDDNDNDGDANEGADDDEDDEDHEEDEDEDEDMIRIWSGSGFHPTRISISNTQI